MATGAKVGLTFISVAVLVGAIGLVSIYKDYIDLVYRESGSTWSPAVGLSIAPLLALVLLAVGLVLLATSQKRKAP